MSITSAILSASSGLAAASRGAEVVAGNVANAGTEGYARREVRLGTMSIGGGAQVRVIGVERQTDPGLAADRRIATAATEHGATRSALYAQLEKAFGTPGEAGALTGRIADFEGTLIAAEGQPESYPRLIEVAASASAVAEALRDVAGSVQDARLRADGAIAADVDLLNNSLQQIHEMNMQIRAVRGQNRDASGLIDQRQRLIDGISDVIPLREMQRNSDEVALYSTTGLVLLDAHPAHFEFTPVPVIGAAMTREAGGLSGLVMDGRELTLDGDYAMVSGGSLGANFAIRDELAPAQAAQLDLLAADLLERFATTDVDPTYTAEAGGVFIDPGPLAPPQVDLGLAGRLQLNAALDPNRGGDVWRLRAGVGAVAAGDPGDSSLLRAMSEAMRAPRTPDDAPDLPARSLAGHAADLVSDVATRRLAEDSRVSFSAAREATLRSLEAEIAVDTDREMQILLRIEKSYSANARVLSVLDQMLARLMEI